MLNNSYQIGCCPIVLSATLKMVFLYCLLVCDCFSSLATTILGSSSVAPCKKIITQLGLLAVYIAPQRGKEGHKALLWVLKCCLEHCLNCVLPWGGARGREGRMGKWGSIYPTMGKTSSLLCTRFLVQPVGEGCPHPYKQTPHLCSIMKPSKHTGSPEQALVESCLHCTWDLRRIGGALFLPPTPTPRGRS